MRKLLLVDDNDRYANALTHFFQQDGWEVVRARSAQEGWDLYIQSKTKNQPFGMVVTDITMETQTSGLWMIRKIHKDGFTGEKGIATTGMDYGIMVWMAKWFLPWFADIDFIIPKKPIREEGKVVRVSLKKSLD